MELGQGKREQREGGEEERERVLPPAFASALLLQIVSHHSTSSSSQKGTRSLYLASRHGDHPRESETLFERLDREAGDRETEVGDGIQRLFGVGRLIYESPTRKHGRVCGWGIHGQLGRSPHQMQQCHVSERCS